MKKLFICLANSKKYGERCVAGIELKWNENESLKVIMKGNKPKWIRPITNSEHGAVPESFVRDMKLLEVYEIEITEECPNGYQSENVKCNLNSLKKVATLNPHPKNFSKITESSRRTIFSNKGKAVHEDVINNVDHSLVFIKADNPEIYTRTEYNKKQIRIKFSYKETSYDLPITDIVFLTKYNNNNKIVEESEIVYITISLGVAYEGWYYKLAAGIICAEEKTA